MTGETGENPVLTRNRESLGISRNACQNEDSNQTVEVYGWSRVEHYSSSHLDRKPKGYCVVKVNKKNSSSFSTHIGCAISCKPERMLKHQLWD